MKKYSIIALTLVLTAVLLTGCRGRNDNMNGTSEPTIMPTVEMPTMAPTTEATTVPTTEATSHPSEPTDASATETVGEDGFVGSDPTGGSDGMEGKARRVPRGR